MCQNPKIQRNLTCMEYGDYNMGSHDLYKTRAPTMQGTHVYSTTTKDIYNNK